MNWTNFQTHNDAPTKAFETLCNQLFENWCKDEYGSRVAYTNIINGAGGDGGVESFAILTSGEMVGLQAKWFPASISKSQMNQIKTSIETAMKVRPEIARYIVCVPRDLANQTARSTDSEQQRWDDMKNIVLSCYPNLQVELWNETRLTTEFQKASSTGIYKFWFDNAEISEDSALFSFEKSKQSWLSTKYVPELNTSGEIDAYITAFLGHKEQRNNAKIIFNQFCSFCEEFFLASNELAAICGDNDPKILPILANASAQLKMMAQEAEKISMWLENEIVDYIYMNHAHFYIDIDTITQQLKDSKEEHHYHFHFCEVFKALRKLDGVELNNAIRVVQQGNDKRAMVFLGNPGTGKTHGVAAITARLFQDGYHVPILIQARDIPASHTWKDIIISSLGLSNNWSEDEIWQALSSLANRKKFGILDTENAVSVLPKIIIMVDGIDESSLHYKWIERIQETKAIIQKYPLIRFCFTSRPYVVSQKIDGAKIIHIGISGDTPTYKLVPQYTEAFNINIKNAGWIKYALTTPLALKLFCDINAGKTITYYDRADTAITVLLKQKISVIENEFCKKQTISLSTNQYMLKSITLIAVLFSHDSPLEKNALIENIANELCVEKVTAETVLHHLQEYGILRLYCKHGKGMLSIDEYFYCPGIQGYFDYVSALTLLEKYTHPSSINFGECTHMQKNTLYALSILSMQNYDYLIINNSSIDRVADRWFVDELLFIALRHSRVTSGIRYKDKLLQIMAEGAESLAKIVNNVILPLSRDSEHPLGSALLDEFLFSFKYPADRDVVWSVPCYLGGLGTDKWCYTTRIALDTDEYILSDEDVADGCPTIFAWKLSVVDNLQRKFYRNTLIEWARIAPTEFYKLFLKFCTVNDPQIRSDMFSILMALLFEDENKELTKASQEWLCANILAPDKIQDNSDIAIRYYSCAIVQKAISLGLVDVQDAMPFLPPFAPSNNYIPLCEEALAGTYMNGYSGIDYDLARYVLIDNLTSSFNCYGEMRQQQFNSLITQITQEQPEYSDMTFTQFILSAAFAFVTNCGWNEENFLEYNSKEKRVIGADCAIGRSYHSATHGLQSQVMTICEKYVWQARKYICGFLADRLLYCDDSGAYHVTDYGLLDDFIIPTQELNQINPDDIPGDHPWHVPEKEVVSLAGICNANTDVVQLVLESPNIDWKQWLFFNNEDGRYKVASKNVMALNSYSCFYGPAGTETCLFISSVIIKNSDLHSFLEGVSANAELAGRISNPTDWKGGIHTSCYITPKEVCWFPWKERYNSWFVEEFPKLSIQSAVDKCCYNYHEYGDVYYDLPSMPIRQHLQIINSDGYLFFDSEKNVKAEYCIAGEKWRTYQDYLLVDKNELFQKLDENGDTLVWFMREYRREDGKSREKFGEFYAEKDMCSIGYFEKTEFVSMQITLKQSSSIKQRRTSESVEGCLL